MSELRQSRIMRMYKMTTNLGKEVHVDREHASARFAFDDGDPFFETYIEEHNSKYCELSRKWKDVEHGSRGFALINPYSVANLEKLLIRAVDYLMTLLVDSLRRARYDELPSVVYDAIPKLPCDLLDIVVDYAVGEVNVDYVTIEPETDPLEEFYNATKYI